jgi:hypothetical protein
VVTHGNPALLGIVGADSRRVERAVCKRRGAGRLAKRQSPR